MVNTDARRWYEGLNDAANKVFFDGRFADRPIHLDLDSGVLEELNKVANSNFAEELCAAVSGTLSWGRPNIYGWHAENTSMWNRAGMKGFPPFTGLLLVLSFAAEKMRAEGDYSDTNYYRRLAELLGASSDHKFSSLKAAGKHTLRFWLDLNRWLRRFDNELGVPTATAIHKSWKYVSYAMSQSLVRDGDKKRMHQMFHNYRMTPGDSVSPTEMFFYLDEWLGHSQSPSWLRRLWANPELRDKVAQSASEELIVWTGSGTESTHGGARPATCKWLAIQKSFPRKKLVLYISLAEDVFCENASLQLEIGNSSYRVAVEHLSGTDESYLAPPIEVSLQALLGQDFDVLDQNSETRVKRNARPIIPLCQIDNGNYFTEVSRVRSNRTHLIFCHIGWKDRVEKHLRTYCNSSLGCIEPSLTSGVPSDWACFTQVIFDRPIDASETSNNQLHVLVPYPELPSIQPIGGLKLGYGIWHSKATPALAIPPVITTEQLISVLSDVDNTPDDSGYIYQTRFDEFDADLLSRLQDQISGKDVTITAGKTVRDLTLGFRTANHTKRKLHRKSLRLFWDFNSAEALISPLYDKQNVNSAEGLLMSSEIRTGTYMLPSSELTTTDFNFFATSSHSNQDRLLNGGSYIPAQCILRGHHYWICEPYLGPATKNQRLVVCKDCNSRMVLPEPKKGSNRSGQQKSSRNPISKFSLAPEIKVERPHIDTVVDAICYRNEGSWNQLKEFLAAVTESPIDLWEYAKRLSDVGILDLHRDIASGAIKSWVVPPPCLVYHSRKNRLVLAVFRNISLVDEITRSLEQVSQIQKSADSENAITIFHWPDIDCSLEKVAKLLANVKDNFDRPIRIAIDPAETILSQSKNLSDITSYLPTYNLDSRADMEKFDVTSGKWLPLTDSQRARLTTGAYRICSRGNMYMYRSADGTAKRGPFDIVKTLAAKDAGRRLHEYEPFGGNFRCLIGADLPPLLSRAVVSSSFRLPRIENNCIVYPDVCESIGRAVLARLYT